MHPVSDALRDARIVVVGAGVVGSAIAYRLAQAGARVIVVERRYPGAGTSGASLAWLNSFRKLPPEYHRLNARSMREHEALASEVAGDWLHRDGGLTWFHGSDAEGATLLRRRVREMNDWGYRVECTTPDVVMRELEPDLWIDPSRVSEVYVVPGEGWVDAVRMAHALLHAALSRFASEVVRASVAGFSAAGRGVDGVTLDDGRSLSADLVVNAAGPWAAQIAQLAGATLALKRQPGVLVATTPAPVCVRAVVHAPECNFRPDGGSRLLLQRYDLDPEVDEGVTPAPDGSIAQRLVAAAASVVPALDGVAAESVRVGVRPIPADGLPIVGFEEGVPGLYEVVTHSGVTLSAILARLVTEELAGADVPELAPYRPGRFSANEIAGVSAR